MMSSFASSSTAPQLPSYAFLQTWCQRPQSIAKCTIADVYGLRAIIPGDVDPQSYLARDVFLLDQWPCRMVNVIGWVAGVDHKETSMTVYVDDGDGKHVLPVTVRLPPRTVNPVKALPQTHHVEDEGNETFLPARERKALRKAAAAEQARRELENARLRKNPIKVYERKDVRVGDTVRIVGKVEEWMRRKASGESEWIRQVGVDEGSGGSITAVDPDEQFSHLDEVQSLRQTRYSQIFGMPSTSIPATLPSSPINSMLYSDSIGPMSEIGSVMDDELDLKLRDPSKLRPSQITDSTFRQYLLDYMIQETTKSIAACCNLERELEALFQEYTSPTSQSRHKGKERETCTADVFSPSTKDNIGDTSSSSCLHQSSCRCSPSNVLTPFTIQSLLSVSHLAQLGRMVVETAARREERRRRRRIKEGQPRPKDLEIEKERKRCGKSGNDWHLTDSEMQVKLSQLVCWVIRGAAEDGSIVQFTIPTASTFLPTANSYDSRKRRKSINAVTYGYLPLPPELVLPLLLPLIESEWKFRQSIFMKKSDSRRINGMTVSELMTKLQGRGEEGRWERVQRWVVQDAVDLGIHTKILRLVGAGYWTS